MTGPDVVDPRWSERGFGDWESRPWDRCWAEAPEALTGIDAYVAFTPPGAEPLDAVAPRAGHALDELDESTVVVTATMTRLTRHDDVWSVRCVDRP